MTAGDLGRFSLFALAPIVCAILLVLLVWPGLWERLTNDKVSLKDNPEVLGSDTPGVAA